LKKTKSPKSKHRIYSTAILAVRDVTDYPGEPSVAIAKITEVVECRTNFDGDEEILGNFVILKVQYENGDYNELYLSFEGLRQIAAVADLFDPNTKP
jgi:hypothetical protein